MRVYRVTICLNCPKLPPRHSSGRGEGKDKVRGALRGVFRGVCLLTQGTQGLGRGSEGWAGTRNGSAGVGTCLPFELPGHLGLGGNLGGEVCVQHQTAGYACQCRGWLQFEGRGGRGGRGHADGDAREVVADQQAGGCQVGAGGWALVA